MQGLWNHGHLLVQEWAVFYSLLGMAEEIASASIVFFYVKKVVEEIQTRIFKSRDDSKCGVIACLVLILSYFLKFFKCFKNKFKIYCPD
jgi:hypothetical protein